MYLVTTLPPHLMKHGFIVPCCLVVEKFEIKTSSNLIQEKQFCI